MAAGGYYTPVGQGTYKVGSCETAKRAERVESSDPCRPCFPLHNRHTEVLQKHRFTSLPSCITKPVSPSLTDHPVCLPPNPCCRCPLTQILKRIYTHIYSLKYYTALNKVRARTKRNVAGHDQIGPVAGNRHNRQSVPRSLQTATEQYTICVDQKQPALDTNTRISTQMHRMTKHIRSSARLITHCSGACAADQQAHPI